MSIRYGFVFNFSASYSGGGLKRLQAYANWFDRNGGAWFIINPRCAALKTQFPNNGFFIPSQTKLQRLIRDCSYLGAIEAQIGRPELYYSYGIPLYYPFGRVNWFHLSNVLPLLRQKVPQTLLERSKAAYLGRRIRRGLAYADVISAESKCSLELIDREYSNRLFLSVNGGDDELSYLRRGPVAAREEIATVLGTQRYKAIGDSVRVFEMLKGRNPQLKLTVFGAAAQIPRSLLRNPSLSVRGVCEREEVINCLSKSRFFISTTCVENSYNAASEGIFMAEESYISDIGPHRELLSTMPFERVSIPGLSRQLLRVDRASLTGANLKEWDVVITEMIDGYRRTSRELTKTE